MKLGSETGSLVNHVMTSTPNNVMPVVGMGVTSYGWSDRNAYTVVRVWTENKKVFFMMSQDTATLVSGSTMFEDQEYTFVSHLDRNGPVYRQNGNSWVRVTKNPETNRWVKVAGGSIRLGYRDQYRDPSF